jgi:hypothetical protein
VVTPRVVGSPDQHKSDFGEVGVVSVSLKDTSLDLNLVSNLKGTSSRGGKPQDVNAQDLVSREMER